MRTLLYRNLVDKSFRCAPGTWTLYQCKECSAAYLDPRPTAESVDLAYAEYYTHQVAPLAKDETGAFARFRVPFRNGYLNFRYGYSFAPASTLGVFLAVLSHRHRRAADRQVRHLQLPPGVSQPLLLDVGCGNGDFMLDMERAGWSVAGIEPDPAAAASARQNGLSVFEGTLAEVRLRESRYHAITLNHVIEHIPDPVQTLKICARILPPGGTLWISTPNLASHGHRLFGSAWRGLEPPRHMVLYTSKALDHALEAAGFNVRSYVPGYSSDWIFRASAAIEQNDTAWRDYSLSRRMRLRARVADVYGRLSPRHGEELVVVASREQ